MKKRIQSVLLIAIYLLVIAHKGICHSHMGGDSPDLHSSKCSSYFEDHKQSLNDNSYYLNLLHFLGHMFEDTQHPEEQNGEHVLSNFTSQSEENFQISDLHAYLPFKLLLIKDSKKINTLRGLSYRIQYTCPGIIESMPFRGPPSE